MHIPDGFLTTPTWLSCWAVAAGSLGFCIRRVAQKLQDKMVPLMGVAAAFIFAAQMVNFPVAAGTSGHLLGGVLAAVLLGPWAGSLVISVVLVAQCLLFQDGGLTALGANMMNMALAGTIVPYFIYKFFRRFLPGHKGILIGTAIASWCSVVIASSLCAIELTLSGMAPLSVALPAMAGVHAVIGMGEAVITCMIIGFVLKTRADLVYEAPQA